MKPLLLAPLLLAPLLAPSSAALAEEMRFGKVTVDIPEGWEREENELGVILSRQYPETEDADQGAAMIQLFNLDGPPATLGNNLADLVAMVDGMAEEDPITESEGVTVGGHAIATAVRCCSYVEDVPMSQTVAGIAGPDQQVLAGLVFINSRSDHEQAAEETFEIMVRSIRFDGDAEGGMQPGPDDGGLEGVYTHLETGLMPNVFGGLDFTADNEITVFAKNGLFSHAMPQGGDIAQHCAATPTDCGTYKVSGGGFWGGERQIEMRTMVNALGVMETETVSLQEDGDTLVIDETEHYRLPPIADGTRFDGVWTYTWASSGMTAAGSGGVAVERTLVLEPDGTFTRDGWSGGSSSGDMGGVTVSSDRPTSSGTYEIAGYELLLEGDDGTTETLSIFAPEVGSDELLVIDGGNYLKED